MKTTSPARPLRRGAYAAQTRETEVDVEIFLDGSGLYEIDTGVGLLDHFLALIFFWAEMDVKISCKGDVHVDTHHTIEDTGNALGHAFTLARAGGVAIERVGFARVPMDEALADVAVDLSGRPYLVWRGAELLPPVLAGQESDVWREFYKAFSSAGLFNLHISFMYGLNGHHLLESAAKGVGLSLRQALRQSGEAPKSTKGVVVC